MNAFLPSSQLHRPQAFFSHSEPSWTETTTNMSWTVWCYVTVLLAVIVLCVCIYRHFVDYFSTTAPDQTFLRMRGRVEPNPPPKYVALSHQEQTNTQNIDEQEDVFDTSIFDTE
jgi:hypothetical protein